MSGSRVIPPMMDDQPHRQSESVHKLRLGGIKFSEALVRLAFSPVAECADLSRILSSFAKQRINLHQLFFNEDGSGGAELYLAEQDYRRNRSLILGELEPSGLEPVVISPVGTLTLFPHGASIDALVKVISLAGTPDTEIYGVCSSLSSFSIATDLDRLDRVAELILEDFFLPEGHSPFRYEPSALDLALTGGQGRVVETVARYWEPVIRIYGSNLKTGLAECVISFSPETLSRVMGNLSNSGVQRFEMMALTRSQSGRCHVQVILDPGRDQGALASMRNCFADEQDAELSVRHGMEMLFFHGPHFQDRYGVIHTAVRALARASIDFRCTSCSGTGVHLIADEGVGNRMLEVLGEVFVVP